MDLPFSFFFQLHSLFLSFFLRFAAVLKARSYTRLALRTQRQFTASSNLP